MTSNFLLLLLLRLLVALALAMIGSHQSQEFAGSKAIAFGAMMVSTMPAAAMLEKAHGCRTVYLRSKVPTKVPTWRVVLHKQHPAKTACAPQDWQNVWYVPSTRMMQLLHHQLGATCKGCLNCAWFPRHNQGCSVEMPCSWNEA